MIFIINCYYVTKRKSSLHFLKAHTIRKVKFLSKNSILTKPQHFHEFFTQKKIKNWQFSREIKVKFLDKNEDFEQFWTFTF